VTAPTITTDTFLEGVAHVLQHTHEMAHVDVALGLAALEVLVVPTVPNDKDPMLTTAHIEGCDACQAAGLTWAKDHGATLDPDVIRTYWAVHSDAGVGMKNHPLLVRGDGDFATRDELRSAWSALRYGAPFGEPEPCSASTPGGTYRRRIIHSLPDGVPAPGGGTKVLGIAWYGDSGYTVVKGGHPKGAEYPPFYGKITPLPEAVSTPLRFRGEGGITEAAATSGQLDEFLDKHTGTERLDMLAERRRSVSTAREGERHHAALGALTAGFREAIAGYYPARLLHQAIHEALTEAGWTEARFDAEWDAICRWALGQVAHETQETARANITKHRDEYIARVREASHSEADIAWHLQSNPSRDFTLEELDAIDAEHRGAKPTRTSSPVNESGVPASWSDAHVGEAFGSTLTGRWLYCRPLGGWFRWDGRRWALDPGEAVHEEFRQWIIELGDRLWKQTGDGDTMKQVARYRDRGKIDAAVTIARRLETVAASADEFDRHPHLLNALNGVVDLRSGSLLSHDPTLRMTKLAGAEYVPNATHPDVNAVLEALNDDVSPWVQRLFGAAASGQVLDDVLAVFDGTGSNGKTTLLKAAATALGDYATPASTRLLMARAATDEHPTLFADLLGRRLVFIEETPEGGALKMEQVKNITGGGAIKARFIGGNYFHFEPTHTIIVATNHRPAVSASDHAAWRRLRLVPFTKTYRLPHEAKPGDLVANRSLRGDLTKPAQRTAMLAWIVAGAVAWYADGGLGACPTVDRATSSWRREEDVIHGWWNDSLDIGGMVGAAELYRSFVAWCEREGRRYISSNKEFAKRFTDHEMYRRHGVEKRDTRSGAVYEGVSVVDVVGVPPTFSRSAVGESTPPPTTRANAGSEVPW
jgi:P4 family phage/plasmid primase-like protien